MQARHRYPYLDFARILAASSVYAFHAGIPGFSWGYIGVDFFMVLSGFVVTLTVIERGGMQPLTFLRARLSRLVPGMVLFLAITTAVLLLLADFNERMGVEGYIIPSGLYYSNWYSIFVADDYFNQNNINVFIHIWSLAVEEQFYIVFAATLLLPKRVHPLAKVILLAVVLVWLVLRYPAMTPDRFYFGTDSRAVQFLVGSLIAHARKPILTHIERFPLLFFVTVFAALMALSIYASADYERYFLYGFIITTLGSGFFLVTSMRGVLVGHTTPPVVERLGHASYTQYLLHMPLIFALAHLTDFELAWKLTGLAMLLAVSYGVSVYFETPAQIILRQRKPATVLMTMPAALLVVSAGCFAAVHFSVPAALRNTNLATGYAFCKDLKAACLRAGEATSPAVLLLGDSVASSVLDGALSELPRHGGLSFVTGALPNCAIRHKLTVSWAGKHHFKYQNCFNDLPGVIASALQNYDIQRVIVSSATDGYPFLDDEGKITRPDSDSWEEQAVDAALMTLDPIIQAEIPITFAVPPQPVPKIECLADGAPCFAERSQSDRKIALYELISAKIPGSTLVNLNDALCHGDLCPLVVDGKITRYDGQHFTRDSSITLASRLISALGITPR